jgi:hypothetical protein
MTTTRTRVRITTCQDRHGAECEQCGWPLDHGDACAFLFAVYDDSSEECLGVFCCGSHARQTENQVRQYIGQDPEGW